MRFCFLFIFSALFLACRTQSPLKQKRAFTEDFNNHYDSNWYAENHTFENNMAHFSDHNVNLANGNMILELHSKRYKEKDFTGAELRTKKMFLYGRFEARLKASDALGCITAFFLYRPNAAHNTEIDFEISGKYPKTITLNHWVDSRSHDKEISLSFDSSKDFHTYVIHWRPDSIEWEIDGQLIHRTTSAVPHKPMQVIFNLWATKSVKWAGSIKEAKLPTFAYVDLFKYTPYKK
ncbi:family 16 glycosylhydrolase [Pedobacter sp. ASV28]|uniref:family 16 glycosylhydrolase n=1 Tax=Pedobacter sp. ASV28 TaxID=2795123 RepID=UPI0018EDC30E|nr:family 16 glycosylhydrolase [Pedobacter sp. ASV28]